MHTLSQVPERDLMLIQIEALEIIANMAEAKEGLQPSI